MIKMAKIDEWALHAFVDNEVAGEGAAEIQEFLKTDAEAASTVESWRLQREALKRGYDGVLDEALPPALAACAGKASSAIAASSPMPTRDRPGRCGRVASPGTVRVFIMAPDRLNYWVCND